jgi:hypothetical protein
MARQWRRRSNPGREQSQGAERHALGPPAKRDVGRPLGRMSGWPFSERAATQSPRRMFLGRNSTSRPSGQSMA